MPSGFSVLYSCGCALNPDLFALILRAEGCPIHETTNSEKCQGNVVVVLDVYSVILTTLNSGHRGTTARREFVDLQISFKIHLRVEGVCNCADKPMLPIVAICDKNTVIKSPVALSNLRASMLS